MIYVTIAFLYLAGLIAFWFLIVNITPQFKKCSKVRVVAVFAIWPLVIIAMAVGPLFMKD
jgi:hypothetical protein